MNVFKFKAKKKNLENEFKAYIIENKETFYRIAYSYVKNENDALDIVQDAIYKGLKSIDSIGEIENFKGWFYRILLRCSIDFIRDNKKYVYVDDDVYFNNISSNDIYKDFDLEDALDNLPEKYKTVVILRYFEDMKIEEIAEVLDENINTIKTRLYSAIKKLNIQNAILGGKL